MGAKPSTIAEEAVDQLQENEKLVAGEASHQVWTNAPDHYIDVYL